VPRSYVLGQSKFHCHRTHATGDVKRNSRKMGGNRKLWMSFWGHQGLHLVLHCGKTKKTCADIYRVRSMLGSGESLEQWHLLTLQYLNIYRYIDNICLHFIVGSKWWAQCPRGVRPGSASARLLRLWIRIIPGTWMFVSWGWVLCFVCWRSLRRADHSSRGVLPSVWRVWIWS